MEQTNLVVTPDGKTWDEVTRDVSYIGNIVCQMSTDTAVVWSAFVIFDEWRGTYTSSSSDIGWFTKDFAIAYDRLICLVDGQYEFSATTKKDDGAYLAWTVNALYVSPYTYEDSSNEQTIHAFTAVRLKRGDYVQLRGEYAGGLTYSAAYIKRI